MSGPPVELLASTTASGYEDGFGRRLLAVDREDGTFLERLYLRPAFAAYEPALRESVARLAAAAGDGRVAAPRSLERDETTGQLVLVSPYVRGDRLSDLIELAHEERRDESVVPGIDVAIGLLLELLPILDGLRARAGLAHGALSASRLILSPDGRLVVVEAGFGAVLQRMNLHRSRLWNEFRLAMPPAAGVARFDFVADIAQAAVSAVSLALGRPLDQRDTPDALPEVMAETIEIAQLRGSVLFATGWQRFLQRALPLPGRRPYESLDAALRDVRQLASAIGGEMCSTALAMFARQMNTPADSIGAGSDLFDAPPALRIESRFVKEQETIVALDAPAEPPALPERAALVEPEPLTAQEPVIEPMQMRPEPAPVSEPIVGVAPALAAAPEPQPMPEPAAAIEPPPPMPFAEEAASTPQPPPAPVPALQADAFAEFTAAVEELDPPKTSSRRRRWRGERHDADTLRSTASPPPAPEPVPAPPVQMAPKVAEPERTIEPPRWPLSQPVFPDVQAVPPPPLWEPPRPVAPAIAAIPVSAAPVPAPSVVTTSPVAAVQPAPAAVLAPPSAPLRIKAEAPAGYVGRPARHEPPMFATVYGEPRRAGASDLRRRLPWKAAAAAAVLLVGIFAAGHVYVPDRETLKAEISEPQPAKTVAAPAPVKTGTLIVQSQPAGARVLLDGGAVGETPLRIVDVAPGRHVVTLITSSATVKRTIRVDADRTVTVDVPVFSGWVAIFAPIVLEVSEDGRSLGTTEQDRILLPPGRHTLTLTNRALGYSTTHAIDVEAGEVASLNIQPRGSVNLNAQPWAEVWIDGRKAGETPIANLELPLGTREIIFRHPELGERRVTTTIRAGSPAAVSIDFTK